MPGTIKLRVKDLMSETSIVPMDLVRQMDLSPTSAYNLYNGKAEAISFKMLGKLCDFFSQQTGRIVSPGEILSYEPDKELQNS